MNKTPLCSDLETHVWESMRARITERASEREREKNTLRMHQRERERERGTLREHQTECVRERY